jgi:Leucine-rich repeat (LRR) protein
MFFKNLQILNLEGNDLKSLPHELEHLRLIEINVQGNNWLLNFPKWIEDIALVTLPDGSKLEKRTRNELERFLVNPEFSLFL